MEEEDLLISWCFGSSTCEVRKLQQETRGGDRRLEAFGDRQKKWKGRRKEGGRRRQKCDGVLRWERGSGFHSKRRRMPVGGMASKAELQATQTTSFSAEITLKIAVLVASSLSH